MKAVKLGKTDSREKSWSGKQLKKLYIVREQYWEQLRRDVDHEAD